MKKWAAELRRCRESLENYERSWNSKEATTDENIELVHSLIMCDRRRSLRDKASQICMFLGSSNYLRVAPARWVPRILTKYQKKSRLDISKYLLSLYEDNSEEFMRRVVTQDETLVHHSDPEAKKQSMQWKHPGSPSSRNLREFL